MAKSINDAGGKAMATAGDMMDAKYIDELVKRAAEFGEGKIHIIVNNAGFTWDGVIHKVRLATEPTRKTFYTSLSLYTESQKIININR